MSRVSATTAALAPGTPISRTSFIAPDPAKVAQLVSGTYFQAIRLGYGADVYLNNQFGLSTKPAANTFPSITWVLRQGSYGPLRAYWIFRSDANQCWQAVGANGPLAMWNADGLAQGPPEDWELFLFEIADSEGTQVRAKNVYGRYVRYGSPAFACDGDVGTAAHFYPEF
jgi:hypothetical protein